MRDIIRADSCTSAWLQAVEHLQDKEDFRDYNLILEISNPMLVRASEAKAKLELDNFLKESKKQPLSTIINTIFPAAMYAKYGKERMFSLYAEEIFPKIQKHPDTKWGTYFFRMTNRIGSDGKPFNPLDYLIEKLKTELNTRGPKRAAYEMDMIDFGMDIPIYQGVTDKHYHMGGPCLSHLSFKIDADGRLLLTAMYRLHFYVQRTLGNLFGLALLLDFVAKEAGIEAGSLVCISTMAVLDKDGIPVSKMKAMLNKCRELQKK